MEVVAGHLIAQLGERRALIDTGSPVSFGTGELSVLNRQVRLMGPEMGVSAEYMTAKIGTRVDTLLGLDLLGTLEFELDCVGGSCVFDTENTAFAGRRIPLGSMMGAPVITATIDGQPVQLILDTGAHTGYLGDEPLRGHLALGTRNDFHPLMGDFATEAHEVPVQIGDLSIALVFGTMPTALSLMMGLAKTDGVIGTDLLMGRRARFALARGEMTLSEWVG